MKIYYEPLIYNFESSKTNGLGIYRTTDPKENYYCPDFVLSFENIKSGTVKYIILDAKYSSRFLLRKHKKLFDAIKKYQLELSTFDESARIEMVGLLQGKAEYDGEIEIEYYHNSPLAKKIKTNPCSFIFNLNVLSDNIELLYYEIIKML